ncbi:MAG: ATP-dependent DNA helicase RecG, partial [Methylococcales bacterium]
MNEALADPQSIPVNQLPGVGSRVALRLEKLGIFTIGDLLFHLPFRYENRSRVYAIDELKPGEKALGEGRIECVELLSRPRRALIVTITDGAGYLGLRFFHFNTSQVRVMQGGGT